MHGRGVSRELGAVLRLLIPTICSCYYKNAPLLHSVGLRFSSEVSYDELIASLSLFPSLSLSLSLSHITHTHTRVKLVTIMIMYLVY